MEEIAINVTQGPSDGTVETGTKRKGCMLCRTEITVETFEELAPGDQISMKGRVPIIGRLYNHHAVITDIDNVSPDKKTARLTVVDVDEKGKTVFWCPCSRKPFPIKEHDLYGKDRHMITTECFSLSGPDRVNLKKVVYRRRKFGKSDTVERARRCLQKDQDIKYCFCLQNCEHLATACVNGPDNLIEESLANSLSLQSMDCFWIIFSILFWAIQAAFYGFHFYMYAVFVAKDPDFTFLSKNTELRNYLEKMCYKSDTTHRGFETTCDWKMIGVFIGVFSILFLCIMFLYYLPLYRKNYICGLCLTTITINLFVSRLTAFIIVEAMNILLESPLYLLVTDWKMNRAETILTLIIVSTGGALMIYTLAGVFTKVIVLILGKCSNRMEGYDFWVPLRGIVWCICKVRCCYRNAKKKRFEKRTSSQCEESTPTTKDNLI